MHTFDAHTLSPTSTPFTISEISLLRTKLLFLPSANMPWACTFLNEDEFNYCGGCGSPKVIEALPLNEGSKYPSLPKSVGATTIPVNAVFVSRNDPAALETSASGPGLGATISAPLITTPDVAVGHIPTLVKPKVRVNKAVIVCTALLLLLF